MPPLILTVDPWLEHVDLAGLLPEFELEQRTLPTADPDAIAVIAASAAPFGVADAEALPALRVVVTASVGYDHLDVQGLAARGIATFCVPGYCSNEVADHALASVLALWRGIPRLDLDRRAGVWDLASDVGLRRIAGSTLGIVGFGRIGRQLAQRGLALGMEVLAYDPVLDDAAIRAAGATPVGLDDLMRASHAVSLHMALVPATEGLIGARELALLQPHSVLVNVSRAGLIDLSALADGLRTGKPSSAAFDVWESEPPLPEDARLDAPNLLLTPHIAYASEQAEAALLQGVADAVRAGLEGRTIDGRLDA
jgi:D-3-phosphoglycerate dehydrogenase / 2-oxoglutarate reductase